MDSGWHTVEAENCSVVQRAGAVRRSVEELAEGSRLAVVEGKGFAGKGDDVRVLRAAFGGGNNGTARLLEGRSSRSVLLRQLLAQNVIATVGECLHALRNDGRGVDDFVDLFGFERGLSPCKKLLFEKSDCSFRVQ